MNEAKAIAIKCATEIVVSKVANSTDRTYLETGKDVANFFEAVYNKIYEVASS